MDARQVATEFEAQRPHLRAVAYRMLGSHAEAEDAVQEAWMRVQRAGTDEVGNLAAWLTTIVSRVALNMLAARKSRREESMDDLEPVGYTAPDRAPSPEHQAVQADAVGLALMVVLDALTPAERLAFVLHDMFAVSFDEIGDVLDKTPAAARQLASRARKRVRGAGQPDPDTERQRRVVEAFLSASRGGDFDALVALLDPDVEFRADPAAVAMGSDGLVRGADAVARSFAGRAKAARLALLDGSVGAVWLVAGNTKVAFGFTVSDGRVTGIDLLADPGALADLEVELLEQP